jgi:aconitate hydratase
MKQGRMGMSMAVTKSWIRDLTGFESATRFLSLEAADVPLAERLPVSLRILLENVLRGAPEADRMREAAAIRARRTGAAISFRPARVLLHDLLGIAAMTDLAALRDAVAEAGGDPSDVNPCLPVTLIVDHSLRVDIAGTDDARERNLALEYERNTERFAFLRWCQRAFRNLEVVPPGKGILHQVNVERLARVVWSERMADGAQFAFPDTLIGTDSHTPMVNGIGVLGWGVGGIEAEAAMLGRSLSLALPEVVGVEVMGRLGAGVTATDLVLAITEKMRARGVVGCFVEFFGRGLDALALADRNTIANMAPEFGATAVLFPIDRHTIDYLRLTGRGTAQRRLVEAYARAQGLWRDDAASLPDFDSVMTIDLGTIRPCIAGPRRPEDRIDLAVAAASFASYAAKQTPRAASIDVAGQDWKLSEGAIVIAAITSCTNTSHPGSVAAAGLLAQKALARGIKPKPWVKTSLAPGSQAIATFLVAAGLQDALDALGFHVIGFGCTTCNGMSGPIAVPIAEAIESSGLLATAVLSGNRNFEGRIHPNVRAAYLASPALVVAYALAGSMALDISSAPIARDAAGRDVFLAELWPSPEEIAASVERGLGGTDFNAIYADLQEGGARWHALGAGDALRYAWDPRSTYIARPPYTDGVPPAPRPPADLRDLRALAILGDSITTDHITPSGAIARDGVAGRWLIERGVAPAEFNSYGTRRGHFELVSRASFANIRLRNCIVPEREGSWTKLMPEGREMTIFDAAQEYRRRGVGLIIVAGKDYGCGSSRDTAAKGPKLLGVAAVVAESFERIHRSNLVGMGILPLEFAEGIRSSSLDLDGSEVFDIVGLANGISAGMSVTLRIRRRNGSSRDVPLTARLDTPEEADLMRQDGILPAVYREFVHQRARGAA